MPLFINQQEFDSKSTRKDIIDQLKSLEQAVALQQLSDQFFQELESFVKSKKLSGREKNIHLNQARLMFEGEGKLVNAHPLAQGCWAKSDGKLGGEIGTDNLLACIFISFFNSKTKEFAVVHLDSDHENASILPVISSIAKEGDEVIIRMAGGSIVESKESAQKNINHVVSFLIEIADLYKITIATADLEILGKKMCPVALITNLDGSFTTGSPIGFDESYTIMDHMKTYGLAMQEELFHSFDIKEGNKTGYDLNALLPKNAQKAASYYAEAVKQNGSKISLGEQLLDIKFKAQGNRNLYGVAFMALRSEVLITGLGLLVESGEEKVKKSATFFGEIIENGERKVKASFEEREIERGNSPPLQ